MDRQTDRHPKHPQQLLTWRPQPPVSPPGARLTMPWAHLPPAFTHLHSWCGPRGNRSWGSKPPSAPTSPRHSQRPCPTPSPMVPPQRDPLVPPSPLPSPSPSQQQRPTGAWRGAGHPHLHRRGGLCPARASTSMGPLSRRGTGARGDGGDGGRTPQPLPGGPPTTPASPAQGDREAAPLCGGGRAAEGAVPPRRGARDAAGATQGGQAAAMRGDVLLHGRRRWAAGRGVRAGGRRCQAGLGGTRPSLVPVPQRPGARRSPEPPSSTGLSPHRQPCPGGQPASGQDNGALVACPAHSHAQRHGRSCPLPGAFLAPAASSPPPLAAPQPRAAPHHDPLPHCHGRRWRSLRHLLLRTMSAI